MKKLLLLLVIVLFSAYAGNVFADPMPVDVFSSNFSISGSISGSGLLGLPPDYYGGYSLSGTSPLGDSVVTGLASAYSYAGFFSVSAYYGTSFSGPLAWWEWAETDIRASATSNIIFSPLSMMESLTIDYDFGGSSLGSATLVDLTNNMTYSPTLWPPVPLQIGHIYDLSLSVAVNFLADMGPYLYIGTDDLYVAAVPEPATMLLLGLGLVGLAGARRKFKK